MERKVVVILGPTASGKTLTAISLAKELSSEVISADSRQVYRFLDIGTAKPSVDELNKVKHHFIGTLTPDEDFNVSRFEEDSLEIIRRLHKEGKIPVVAGGSGLYIKALVEGISTTAATDEELRLEIKTKLETLGREHLYEELKIVDPKAASTMLPQNYKRVMRALEVFHLTGRSILEHHEEYERNLDFQFLQFGLNWQRDVLYRNIEKRVDEMIESGLVDEVKSILQMGYSKDLNSLNTVGYKEIILHLSGEISLERAVELIKRNTRRYAKRQMTWFRRNTQINWFDIHSLDDLLSIPEKILRFFQ
ncbi:MAG: tRNA (adenosine(37)-N6)-dimethylallyltransferase MiaA [Ignavibacteria bacterium]|nr:tRNA (adenosine(37)-N6)-dimethylallyltransferase MiaA [Ignavibacteria bacterium]MCU7512679.1 tRNA (adenosine(37)-N6)-dimethylallyltransferase MiaA [Ignavibacteria bacterium]MCU7520220.1 tRNA (adenosine(37)-N6)-dimethylallyltransferase MiaA [Ignavibacteria bacterium]MCU7523659.1 tRNA (adenosine(37)-N6)-dimethylallyltransferase MiaA [Ignavibacteria bacterium]